jgi:hypothetical protein
MLEIALYDERSVAKPLLDAAVARARSCVVCAERVVAIPTYGGRSRGSACSAAAYSWGIAASATDEDWVAASRTDEDWVAASATDEDWVAASRTDEDWVAASATDDSW